MKFCQYCGNQIADEATFCSSCGAKQEIKEEPVNEEPKVVVEEKHIYVHDVKPEPQGKPKSGLGIAGFILGIIAIVFCWIPGVNIVSTILAIIGGILCFVGLIIAIVKKKRLGLVIAGLIICILAIVGAVAVVDVLLRTM